MALETLSNIKQIDGFTVDHLCDPIRTKGFIEVSSVESTIKFKIQSDPIKEVGLNGCQFTALIKTALHILEGLDKKYPCVENKYTIMNLEQALIWQENRTRDREKRGVEGVNII